MRKAVLTVVLVFNALILLAQKEGLRSTLYKLDSQIIRGDINALKQLSVYLDDTTFVQEFLGYHNYPNNARNIAIRIINENCLFVNNEFALDTSVTAKKFLQFVNEERVIFDDVTGTFLVTPLTKKIAAFKLKKLSKRDLERIDTTLIRFPFPHWYEENQIEWLLKRKNPEALMWIASAWYKSRARFNRYYFSDNEFLDLIKKLTHIDLGVQNSRDKIDFLYQDDYYGKAKLNFLTYWVNHARDYRWNEKEGYFENISDSAEYKSTEDILFALLNSTNDTVAIDAFAQLTELDTGRVGQLAEEYESNDEQTNFSIPTFPYRFLKQMVFLTQYCRDNAIRYQADGWLLDSLNKLKSGLSFADRHRLENSLINNLTLEDITMVEFFGLLNEKDWGTTYSLGRILDKFYSRSWKAITSSEKNACLYLKKAAWFDNLGIIGNCNTYLLKFKNSSNEILSFIKSISTSKDAVIRKQCEKILALYSLPITPKNVNNKKAFESNRDFRLIDLKDKYRQIIKSGKKNDEKRSLLVKLFGQISYKQMGEAITILMGNSLLEDYDKFHFLESDFGFIIDTGNKEQILQLLKLYQTKSEYTLYEYYLKKTGMNCLDNSGNLNYTGVYDILKYNIIDAFVGGGGGKNDDGVYLTIKLLEIKFKTTLGFPKKRCNWQGMWGCDCTDRARAWRKFLTEKKLVLPDTEPVSISAKD